MVTSLWFKIGAIVVLIFGAFTFGVRYEKGQQARDEVLIAAVGAAAQQAAADAIAKIKITNQTVQGKIEVQTREVPVYTDCKLTPDVLGLLNDALSGRADAAGSGLVP